MSTRPGSVRRLLISALLLVGCASVEPLGFTPDGSALVEPPPGGGASGQAGAGAIVPSGGAGGESDGVSGNDTGGVGVAGGAAPGSGAGPGGGAAPATGGASAGGTAGAPSGGSSGGGTCYVAGCPGCILTSSSLLGVPCCTSAGKCGCQQILTNTCK
ncbi:MAG TPA: hypothetical protein VHC69_35725 [Polyangiaceae bacterium]|nr:hypothetical protein [Polyangiaceae bacterium]